MGGDSSIFLVSRDVLGLQSISQHLFFFFTYENFLPQPPSPITIKFASNGLPTAAPPFSSYLHISCDGGKSAAAPSAQDGHTPKIQSTKASFGLHEFVRILYDRISVGNFSLVLWFIGIESHFYTRLTPILHILKEKGNIILDSMETNPII